MRYDILFKTARFNLSQPYPYFINDCCFGDDLAKWLVSQLPAVGIETDEPYQEDWGWEFAARLATNQYYIGVGGLSDEDPADPNRGEFRIMISKQRTLWERLSGKNKIRPDEAVLRAVETILAKEEEFVEVRRESVG
jgi:hypothetical protein